MSRRRSLNRAAWTRRASATCTRRRKAPSGAASSAPGQLLDRVDAAICALNGPEAVGWTQAYLR